MSFTTNVETMIRPELCNLTQEQAFFVAPTLTHKTPWSKVISIVRDGRVLRVQRRDRQTPTEFWFDSRSDAAMAAHVATRLWSK
jgi:hypothetical protein